MARCSLSPPPRKSKGVVCRAVNTTYFVFGIRLIRLALSRPCLYFEECCNFETQVKQDDGQEKLVIADLARFFMRP